MKKVTIFVNSTKMSEAREHLKNRGAELTDNNLLEEYLRLAGKIRMDEVPDDPASTIEIPPTPKVEIKKPKNKNVKQSPKKTKVKSGSEGSAEAR